MRSTVLLSAAIIAAGLSVATAAQTGGANARTAKTAQNSAATEKTSVAAERFLQHINDARVAIALKKGELAKGHIIEAERLNAELKNATPIETRSVKLKELDTGPFWAKKQTLAVTDASIVYLTLDLRENAAGKYLERANDAINEGEYTKADAELAALTGEVVTAENKQPLSRDVARDNIALARNFIASGNYDGGRFALKHADSALENLEIDDGYKTHRTSIAGMRKEVSSMQKLIRRKDPTLLQRADITMEKWLGDMKGWATN